MLASARALVSGERSMIEVTRELYRFCDDAMEPEVVALLEVFAAIHSETDALAVGKERTLWNAAALALQGEKIAAAEHRWRDRAVRAATELVRLLEGSN